MVAGRGGGQDGEARELGELDAVDARGGGAAVDEDGGLFGGGVGGEGELEGLVEALALFAWMAR